MNESGGKLDQIGLLKSALKEIQTELSSLEKFVE